MENNNAVPEGQEPPSRGPSRPVSPESDPDVPEFLKGPDPDEPDAPDAPPVAGGSEDPRDAAAGDPGPQWENGMSRDAWDAEFSSVDGTDETSAGSGDAVDESTAGDGDTAEDAEPATAAVAADEDPSRTRALPTWDQDASNAPQTPRRDPDEAGADAPEQDPDHQPISATSAASATGAAAGAGAVAASGTPAADSAADGPVATDPDAPQRTDAVMAAKRRGGAPRQPVDPADPDAERRQNARDAALTAKPMFARIVQTLLAIAFPFLLVIAAIRAVASPWFLWLEYHRPGFPADTYGFGPAERLTYGNYGVDYINNSAPSSYLGNLVNGKGDPLFLATEVSHMADVKAIVGASYAAGIIVAVLAILVCLYLGRRYAGGMRRAFFAGSVITLVVMIALTVLAVLNFATFFTDFHELLFAQGNWTFHANDTLIRLYPTQFWMDAGIVIAGLVLVVSLVFLITNWPTRKRRERSRLRQDNRDLGLD